MTAAPTRHFPVDRLAHVAPAILAGCLALVSSVHASMWADEVATWSAATRSWDGLHRLVRHQDVVFALYYATMHLWVSIVGHGPFAMRLPSLVACIATVAVTARMTTRVTGSRYAGLAAGAWLTLNPFFVFFGSDARPYAFIALLAALDTQLVIEPGPVRRARAVRYALLSVLGLYLHLYFALLVMAHAAGLAVADRRRARSFLASWVAICVSAVPLAVAAFKQRAQIGWLPHTHPAGYYTWWSHLVGRGALVSIVFAALCIYGVSRAPLPRSTRIVLLAVAVIGPLVLVTMSWWWPTYDGRYVVECVPAIAVVVGAATLTLGRRLRSYVGSRDVRGRVVRAGYGAGVVAAALALSVNAMSTLQQQRRGYFYENLAAAASRLRAAAGAGTGVIFVPAEARGALYYYLDADQDGDLGVVDVNSVPGATPPAAANFSGLNRPLTTTMARAGSYRTLIVVELGATPAPVWTRLNALLGPTRTTERQSFGAMTLVYLRRSPPASTTDAVRAAARTRLR